MSGRGSSRLTLCSPMHILSVRTVHGRHTSPLWQLWVTVSWVRPPRGREGKEGEEGERERGKRGKERGRG